MSSCRFTSGQRSCVSTQEAILLRFTYTAPWKLIFDLSTSRTKAERLHTIKNKEPNVPNRAYFQAKSYDCLAEHVG